MTVAPVRTITNRLDAAITSQAELLDTWAKPVQGWIASAVRFGGTAGQASKNFLNGVWLEHPLHPALTDVPIGAWFVSLIFDMLGFEESADASLRIGVLTAIPTALAGAADWADASEQPRRVGLVHALLNIGALGLYLGSMRARSMGNRGFGAGLSASGFTLASLAAWLGGELVYRQGTNVNRTAWTPMVLEFMGAADYDSLEDGKLASASIAVDGQELRLLLLKRGDEVLALGARVHTGAVRCRRESSSTTTVSNVRGMPRDSIYAMAA